MTIFTICSNNYLAQANVLGMSLKKHNPSYTFQIFLCDIKQPEINYNLMDFEVIEISSIEPAIISMAQKYNIIELNTAVKPSVFEFLFNQKQISKAVYLDPDICVYDSLIVIDKELEDHSILLTPHILTPLPLDGKSPNENIFLNHGIFNLGFIGLKKDDNSAKLLTWWKGHTFQNGFIAVGEGIFVDQLPMNLAPIFFLGVKVLRHAGCNMAPWNLHERYLQKSNEKYAVNKLENLVFFHFSSFKLNENELSRWCDRYKLADRLDLQEIYSHYKTAVIREDFFILSKIKSVYTAIYESKQNLNKHLNWQQTSMIRKIIISFKKAIPNSIKNFVR